MSEGEKGTTEEAHGRRRRRQIRQVPCLQDQALLRSPIVTLSLQWYCRYSGHIYAAATTMTPCPTDAFTSASSHLKRRNPP
jgi:hypothetical protein